MNGASLSNAAPTDAASLLAACRRRAGAAWREIGQVIEALSGGNGNGVLNDRQRAQIGNMLRWLVGEVAATLHRALAAALEGRSDLRREAVAAFAASAPVAVFDRLVAVRALFDPPLVEAALHRMFESRLAATLRPRATGAWRSEAAPDSGDALAATVIGDAADRRLAERLNGYLVERTRHTDGYGEPMLHFDELEPDVVERLFWNVAVLLSEDAAARLDAVPGTVENEVQRVVIAELEGISARAATASPTAQAVDAIEVAGVLDGALAVEVLRHGEVPLFLALFARLARLRVALTRRLIFETDGFGLAILARALGLGADRLKTVFALTCRARTSTRAGIVGDVRRLAAFYERIDPADAGRVCDHWRLDRRYLEAMWRLGAAGSEENGTGG